MEDAGDDKLHVVVFPWLAFGHMLPFLELSKSLARRGHLVSFIATPKNIQRLPKVPPEISHLLRLVPLPLPRVDGMAEGVEATSDLPPADCHYLKKAIDGLEQPFSAFLNAASRKKPDWIIQDFVQHWIPKAADEAGVPCVFFGTTPASCLAFLGPPSDLAGPPRRDVDQFTAPPPWVPFPTKVAYRRHEIFKMAADAGSRPNSSGVGDGHRIMTSVGRSRAVAVRSCAELEPEWLPLLRRVYDKPVLPVGLLPPLAAERDERRDDAEAEVLGWLDGRSAGSVVYVALGSEVAIGAELLHELALGLELAGVPFLWGLRRPLGASGGAAGVLPGGFEERTRGFGKVAMGWVPQVRVLAHASVGGFLTHCGWSSAIEGLQRGHPLAMLPVFGDQGLNARMLGEKGLGVEVERKEEDGSFGRDEVRKAVRLVMVEEEGDAYRKKAREMEEVLADRERQERYLDDFVQYLLANRNSPP